MPLTDALMNIHFPSGPDVLRKAVEYIPHFLKNIPPVFALPVFGITQYVQLDIEQFLEFQAVLDVYKRQASTSGVTDAR